MANLAAAQLVRDGAQLIAHGFRGCTVLNTSKDTWGTFVGSLTKFELGFQQLIDLCTAIGAPPTFLAAPAAVMKVLSPPPGAKPETVSAAVVWCANIGCIPSDLLKMRLAFDALPVVKKARVRRFT